MPSTASPASPSLILSGAARKDFVAYCYDLTLSDSPASVRSYLAEIGRPQRCTATGRATFPAWAENAAARDMVRGSGYGVRDGRPLA